MAEWSVRVVYDDGRPPHEFEVFGRRIGLEWPAVSSDDTLFFCALDDSSQEVCVVVKNFDRETATVARVARFALSLAEAEREA